MSSFGFFHNGLTKLSEIYLHIYPINTFLPSKISQEKYTDQENKEQMIQYIASN